MMVRLVPLAAHGSKETRPGELVPEALGRIALRNDDPLEIEARRQIEIGMGGTGEAVDAAMLAAAIGIDRLLERDVGRVVRRDDLARLLEADLGVRPRR